ncbi:hypothetical protein MRX96_056370 [Rhipicephalus microplus]
MSVGLDRTRHAHWYVGAYKPSQDKPESEPSRDNICRCASSGGIEWSLKATKERTKACTVVTRTARRLQECGVSLQPSNQWADARKPERTEFAFKRRQQRPARTRPRSERAHASATRQHRVPHGKELQELQS